MPHYLDNIWGDQQVVRGFGDALNNNFAALVAARNQQRKQEQDAALNAAYYALERQKLMMSQPGMEAQTAEAQARAKLLGSQNTAAGLQNQLLQQEMGDINQLRGATYRQNLMAHPAMQPVPPQMLPSQPPMMMQTNAMEAAMPSQVPSVYPPGAPTIGNANQMDLATINSILASQAAQTPAGSLAMLQGVDMRPGDVHRNIMTGQTGQQVPGFVSPYQFMQYGLAQERQQTAEERAAEYERHNKAMEDKPGHESELDRALREARERRQGKGDGSKIVKTQADFDALPPGTVYTGTDGKRYRKP